MTHHTGSDEGRVVGRLSGAELVALDAVFSPFFRADSNHGRYVIDAVERILAARAAAPDALRERLLAWIDDQRQLLPEHRTPVAHGKAELLADLHVFLAERPTDGAGT